MDKTSSRPEPGYQRFDAAEYEKQRYRHYDQRIINRLEHRIIDRLLEASGTDGTSLLNVPSGYGRFSEILARRYRRICCYDLRQDMLRLCLARPGLESAAGVRGDIRRLPFPDGSFDMVVNIRFFHHTFEDDDRLSMLKELHRVSRKCLLTTYYRKSPLHGLAKRASGKSSEVVMFDRRAFLEELESLGFRTVVERALIPILHAQRFLLLEKI